MPSNAQVSFTPGTLPPGYCFTTWQQLYIDMVAQLTGYLPGNYSTFNFGSTVPSPEDQDKPWIRQNMDGSPDRLYVYFDGAWCALHPTPAGGSERRMWVGTEVNLQTYDGGGAGAVTDTTGPMWEVDHNFDARFPIGPGTLPSTTVINVGDTGGEEKHLLTGPESGTSKHTHVENAGSPGSEAVGGGGANRVTFGVLGDPGAASDLSTANSSEADATTSHNNMPPYRGIFVIKRTARVFYTA